MSDERLEAALEALEDRMSSDAVVDGSDAETALAVPCSMTRCAHRETLWPADPSWHVVGVPTLGNQTWDHHDGELVLDGTLAHLRSEHDVAAVLVVGHTGCSVVEDAYDQSVAPTAGAPAGVQTRLRPLVSLAERAFEEGVFDDSMPARATRTRLVEYNVVRQVTFLRRVLPDSVTAVGYVYDQDGVYSPFPDEYYLVTVDGATEHAEVVAHLPDEAPARVASLLS